MPFDRGTCLSSFWTSSPIAMFDIQNVQGLMNFLYYLLSLYHAQGLTSSAVAVFCTQDLK